MLQRLKSMFSARKELTQLERVSAFDLNERPFARALLLRAAYLQDEAIRDLGKMGSTAAVRENKSLVDAASSSATTVAYHVTTEACKVLGQSVVFMPFDAIPKHAPMVTAFSLFVLAGIHGQLNAEGVALDFSEASVGTALLFSLGHSDEKRLKQANQSIAAFRSVVQASGSNVKEWRDNCMTLVPMYVLQWTTTDEKLKNRDFTPLFASMLSSLLKC